MICFTSFVARLNVATLRSTDSLTLLPSWGRVTVAWSIDGEDWLWMEMMESILDSFPRNNRFHWVWDGKIRTLITNHEQPKKTDQISPCPMFVIPILQLSWKPDHTAKVQLLSSFFFSSSTPLPYLPTFMGLILVKGSVSKKTHHEATKTENPGASPT